MARTEIYVAQALVGAQLEQERLLDRRRGCSSAAQGFRGVRTCADQSACWGPADPKLGPPVFSRVACNESWHIAAFSQERGRSLKTAAR
jgi:hypothetical protein